MGNGSINLRIGLGSPNDPDDEVLEARRRAGEANS
jgi:hypothetical protein